jgi:hypothetical protein
MLSEKLSHLAGQFESFRGCSLQIDGAALDHLCGLLRDLAADARAIEGHAVPASARLDPADLSDNVVALDPRRGRANGGDAA